MRYLKLEEVLLIHERLTSSAGQSRDKGLPDWRLIAACYFEGKDVCHDISLRLLHWLFFAPLSFC